MDVELGFFLRIRGRIATMQGNWSRVIGTNLSVASGTQHVNLLVACLPLIKKLSWCCKCPTFGQLLLIAGWNDREC